MELLVIAIVVVILIATVLVYKAIRRQQQRRSDISKSIAESSSALSEIRESKNTIWQPATIPGASVVNGTTTLEKPYYDYSRQNSYVRDERRVAETNDGPGLLTGLAAGYMVNEVLSPRSNPSVESHHDIIPCHVSTPSPSYDNTPSSYDSGSSSSPSYDSSPSSYDSGSSSSYDSGSSSSFDSSPSFGGSDY